MLSCSMSLPSGLPGGGGTCGYQGGIALLSFLFLPPRRAEGREEGGWGGAVAQESWLRRHKADRRPKRMPRRHKADRRPKRESLACSGPDAASWRAWLNRSTAGAGWLTGDSNTRIDGACRFAYTNIVVRTCCQSD